MTKRVCLLTDNETECREECFNCYCGGKEATKNMYVSINNVQRVCSIAGGAVDTDEGEHLAEVIRNNLERMIDIDGDVQPVKREHWTEEDDVLTWEGSLPFHSCSGCGFTLCDDLCHINGSETINISKRFRYCPNCGARMDGDAE